ncbi:hypothetical protein GT360_12615 [Vibrio astriarenae]|uniref:DUF6701 domain-containing protein n=1 Tax=Vibrio astriarenae TaxID=1481923 RepID=A0A7Z2T4X3_9VIBR|nr:DUF6701 domain-containing protein [Vibrio astriarenae]QIA64301.1 hypothetical protein GT360_12615 [Vibrio astriarenae]
MIKHFWVGLALVISSSFASANDFDPSTCDALRSDNDFSVSFSITNAQYQETVWADKGVGGGNQDALALWTDNPAIGPDGTVVTMRAGNEIQRNQDYQILLTYDSSVSGNKQGLLQYYLLQGGQWLEIDEVIADFSSLNSVHIDIEGESVDDLECADGIVTPPPPEFSDDAQYEFGVVDCSSGSCTIRFNQTYDFVPLVFVMPTISTVEPDRQRPATLNISSVSRTEAHVSYKSVNVLGANRDTEMSSVSYLVIEPGIANFGGHTVLAGYLDTARYKSKNGSQSSERVDFSDFGLDSPFSTNPVVLHQIQSNNNGDKWLTSGKARTNQDQASASLFLEASASKNTPYHTERLGFLATESVRNLNVGDYVVEFARGTDTISQGYPGSMANGCENSWVQTQLTQLDGIIANKQERAGGHGGWLRRCEITEDARVSFVVDEDYFNRGHIPEEVGHFAFELVEPEIPDICPYFPAVAQSWAGSLESHFDFPSGSDGKLIGTVNLLGEVGFNRVSKGWDSQKACDGKECRSNGDLILPNEPPVLDLNIIGGELELGNNSGPQEVPGTNFTKLTIGNAGEYTMSASVYEIGELVIQGSAKVTFPNATLLKVNKITLSNNAILQVDSDPLIIWAENLGETKALIDFQDTGPDIEAYLFSRDTIKLEGSMKVFGAATADELLINGSARLEYMDLGCGQTPSDYRIELTPISDIALTCEDIELTATVYNGDNVYTAFNGNITLDGDTFTPQTSQANAGVANFSLSSGGAAHTKSELYAEAQVEGSTYRSNTSDNYQFVPYRFDITEQFVIAGREYSVSGKVLACDNNNGVVDVGYSGTPTVSYGLDIPATGGRGVLSFLPTFSSGTITSATNKLKFDDSGVVSVTLTDDNFNCDGFSDCPIEGEDKLTGQFKVNARPWTLAICGTHLESGTASTGNAFVAAGAPFGVEIIPINWLGSTGQEYSDVQIETTQSLCDSAVVTENFRLTGSPNTTTSLSQILDSPAGGSPGVFTDKDVAHDSTNTDGIYYVNDLTWSEVGSLRLYTSTQTSNIDNEYLGMKINQGFRIVGRFYPDHFVVEEGAWVAQDNQGDVNYLGQEYKRLDLKVYPYNTLNPSQRVRNYSLFSTDHQAYFPRLEDNQYASRITGWESSKAENKKGWGDDSQLSAAVWQPTFTPTFERLGFGGATTNVDGPFNTSDTNSTATSLELVIQGDDPVRFGNTSSTASSEDTQLLKPEWQPPARYGRMVLADVSGSTSGSIRVPLRVEYFDGSSFVVNDDDDASGFDHNKHCTLDGVSTNASFSFDGAESSVSSGTNNNLLALRSGTNTDRETVRLFLRQGGFGDNPSDINCQGQNFTQPWLQYNWRDKGDEDPSTLVTFGVYRGNDRIIFRGEPGLTGQ